MSNNLKRDQYFNFGQRILKAEKGLGQVWISGYEFAHNLKELQKNKIEAVCSAVDLGFKYFQNVNHIVFNLKDTNSQSIEHTFEPAYQFIDKHRKSTNVLIHCAAGISRSVSILIAYMIIKYGLTYNESIQIVKRVRPWAKPNLNFINQLLKLEVKIRKQRQKQLNNI